MILKIVKIVLVPSYLVGLNIHLPGVLCFWREHDFSLTQYILFFLFSVCYVASMTGVIAHYMCFCFINYLTFFWRMSVYQCSISLYCCVLCMPGYLFAILDTSFFNQHKFVLNSGKQFFEPYSMDLVWILESIFEPDNIKLFLILESSFLNQIA